MQQHYNGLDDVADIHRKMDEEEELNQSSGHSGMSKKSAGDLTVSNAGDPSETEADSIADKVADGQNVSLGSLATSTSQVSASSDGETNAVDSEMSGMLSSSKGAGNPMDDDTRSTMESQMNTDFSDVKIHTGAAANKMNENVNAKAFAHGQDLYFRDGYYNPGSKEGKELLAHELVHTKQVSRNGISTKLFRNGFDEKPIADKEFVERVRDGKTPITELATTYYTLCGQVLENHKNALLKFHEYMTNDTSKDNKVDVQDLIIDILMGFLKPLGGQVFTFIMNILQGVQFPIPPQGQQANEIDWGGVGLEGLKSAFESLKNAYNVKMEEFQGGSLTMAWDVMTKGVTQLQQDFQKKAPAFAASQEKISAALSADSGFQKEHRDSLVTKILELNDLLKGKYSEEKLIRDAAFKWIAKNMKLTKKGRPKSSGSHIKYVLVEKSGSSKPELEEVSVEGPKGANIEDMLEANMPTELEKEVPKKTGWKLNEINVPVHIILYKEFQVEEGAEVKSEWVEADRWMVTHKLLSASAQDKRRARSSDPTQMILNDYLKKPEDLPMITHFGSYDASSIKKDEQKEKKKQTKREKAANTSGFNLEDVEKNDK